MKRRDVPASHTSIMLTDGILLLLLLFLGNCREERKMTGVRAAQRSQDSLSEALNHTGGCFCNVKHLFFSVDYSEKYMIYVRHIIIMQPLDSLVLANGIW